MIEIKDTRKTATIKKSVKIGGVARIGSDYCICCRLEDGNVNLFSLTDGHCALEDGCAIDNSYVFSPSQLGQFDIEVITNKITLTIE